MLPEMTPKHGPCGCYSSLGNDTRGDDLKWPKREMLNHTTVHHFRRVATGRLGYPRRKTVIPLATKALFEAKTSFAEFVPIG